MGGAEQVAFITLPASARRLSSAILITTTITREDVLLRMLRQFFVLQQPAVPEPPKAPIHPLLIELQGDRYVRVGEAQGNDQMAALQPPSKFIEPQKEVLSSSSALTPTVLIYRNGVRESIPQYAIVGKVIYARGNYWQDGYWTKNIEISALNLPATIQVNQDNGVRFTLPAGPSEVVTRP